jgi:hypothetical protein
MSAVRRLQPGCAAMLGKALMLCVAPGPGQACNALLTSEVMP